VTRAMPPETFSRMSAADRRKFTKWARAATKGVAGSAVFLQIFNATALTDGNDLTYALQLGAAILLDKPIVIVAPEGSEIPSKLKAIATSIQFFIPDDEASTMLAVKRALHAAGVVRL
jgi:hypothetical protein